MSIIAQCNASLVSASSCCTNESGSTMGMPPSESESTPFSNMLSGTLSHLTRRHGTRRTRKNEYPTRTRQPPESGHGGHVIYNIKKNIYILYKLL